MGIQKFSFSIFHGNPQGNWWFSQAELVAKVLKSVVSMATAALCTLLSASAGAARPVVWFELVGKTF